MSVDPEIQTFIADTEAYFPPDAGRLGIAEQRALYDAYAAAFASPRPDDIAVDDGTLVLRDRQIGLRRYRAAGDEASGTILYAHGGGFVLGSLESHDGIVARLAARTKAEVVAIDYRLAPEHPAPAARDDVVAVLDAWIGGSLPWRSRRSAPLVLAGDSAGATLVASAILKRSLPRGTIAGLALIYPLLGQEPAAPARDTEAFAPMLTLAEVRAYRDAYLSGGEPDAWTFPLDAPDLAGLPPTFLLAAEHDPLRDDCERFARRVWAAGGSAETRVAEGLVHGFLRAIDCSAAAAAAFDAAVHFVTSALRQEKA